MGSRRIHRSRRRRGESPAKRRRRVNPITTSAGEGRLIRMASDRRATRAGRGRRNYGHPAAKVFRKHWKSLTLRMGGVVEESQLAYGAPAANRFMKHTKS